MLYTGDPSLLISQVLGIVVTLVLVVVVDAVIILVVRALFGGRLRADDREEALGMDVTLHGESAYPAYTGLDS